MIPRYATCLALTAAFALADYSFHGYRVIQQMRARCWDQFMRAVHPFGIVLDTTPGDLPRPRPEWLRAAMHTGDEIDQLVDWSLRRGRTDWR